MIFSSSDSQIYFFYSASVCFWLLFSSVQIQNPRISDLLPLQQLHLRFTPKIPNPVLNHQINSRTLRRIENLSMAVMEVVVFLITFSLAIYTFTAFGVYFPVNYIKYSPYIGFYTTRVKFGNPAQEFTVQIHMGTDMSWIACHGCTGCPSRSAIDGIQLNFYDPSQSHTSSVIGCSDPKCTTLPTENRTCATLNSTSCTYLIQYIRDSTTQGYYVSDIMHIDMVIANRIIFGCSLLQSGALMHPEDVFDGIFALGINGTVLSQLSSNGVVPLMFSLCLDGSEDDSSFLYFGEIEESDIVYTPLVPSKSNYCLNLQTMYVNDKKLSINSSVFTTPTMPGIVVDSGISLAYLPDDAYIHFIDAITSSLKPQIVQQYEGYAKRPCFVTHSSIDDVFPTIKLHFAGGGVMKLYPRNYLILQYNGEIPTSKWCMAWEDNGQGGETILGDIALKNKLLVHDLVNNRFGWKEQKCSAHPKFLSGQNRISNKVVVILVTLAVLVLLVVISIICYVHRCR